MKITIINPTYERSDEYYDLGVASIASVINSSERHEATVIDFSFVWDQWEEHLEKGLLEFRPEVVGMSTYSPRMPQALNVARHCKKILPGVKIVMGGHHASLGSLETLKRDCVDFVVVGEAENTIIHLLNALEDKTETGFHHIPFLAFKEGDQLIENSLGKLPTAHELDVLPFNDWTLWKQHKKAIFHCGYLPVIGVRGCPYKCSFCSSPILSERLSGTGPFVRQKSATRTAEEVAYQWERHKDDGLRYIMFYDQNFFISAKWLEDFCAEYIRLGMHKKLPFSCYSRLDHLTKQKLDMAKEAGCVQLRVGIESGNEQIRNNLLNKELSQEMMFAKMKLLKDSGIRALGYFIIGNPHESFAQANESFKVARKLKLDRAAFFFLTPLHNLPIQKDVDVDYLELDKSLGFSIATGLTVELRGYSKMLLTMLFYKANGWFLAKTFFAQLWGQGPKFLWGFPSYYRRAKKDGFDLQKSLLQYIYYHGDSYLY